MTQGIRPYALRQNFARRERPKVFLVDGEAKWLYNGMKTNDQQVFTFVQRLTLLTPGKRQRKPKLPTSACTLSSFNFKFIH